MPLFRRRRTYLLQNRYQDSGWETLEDVRHTDVADAIRDAENRSRDSFAYGMIRVVAMPQQRVIVEFSAGHPPYHVTVAFERLYVSTESGETLLVLMLTNPLREANALVAEAQADAAAAAERALSQAMLPVYRPYRPAAFTFPAPPAREQHWSWDGWEGSYGSRSDSNSDSDSSSSPIEQTPVTVTGPHLPTIQTDNRAPRRIRIREDRQSDES